MSGPYELSLTMTMGVSLFPNKLAAAGTAVLSHSPLIPQTDQYGCDLWMPTTSGLPVHSTIQGQPGVPARIVSLTTSVAATLLQAMTSIITS